MIEMKDVAQKLRDWRNISIPKEGRDIAFLIELQRQLQIFFKNNSDEKHGKNFADIKNVKDFKETTRIFWTKQNILRIFDQISQFNAWIKDKSDNAIQNLAFQLIDMMHFVFNIALLWEVEDKVTKFGDYAILTDPDYNNKKYPHGINLSNFTSQLLATVSWKCWKNFEERNTQKIAIAINNLLLQILSTCRDIGFRADDVYKMYVSKNRQNINRQISTKQYKN